MRISSDISFQIQSQPGLSPSWGMLDTRLKGYHAYILCTYIIIIVIMIAMIVITTKIMTTIAIIIRIYTIIDTLDWL